MCGHKIPILPFIIMTIVHIGCATAPSVVREPYPPTPITTADDLQTVINDRASRITTLKASGTISIYEEESEPYSYPIIVMYKKPDRLYVKAHKPLRPVIFTLISNEENFYIFIPQDTIIYTGKNNALYNSPEYDISLTPEFFLQALFTRRIPLSYATTMEQSNEDYMLSVFNPENNLNTITSKIWSTPPYFFCTKELHYSSKGVMLYEVKRNNFTIDKHNQAHTAHTIFLRNIRTNVAIGLNFTKVLINEDIDDADFEFHFPEGVDIEIIE